MVIDIQLSELQSVKRQLVYNHPYQILIIIKFHQVGILLSNKV